MSSRALLIFQTTYNAKLCQATHSFFRNEFNKLLNTRGFPSSSDNLRCGVLRKEYNMTVTNVS